MTDGADVLGGRRSSVAVVLLTYRPDTAGFAACLTSVLTSGEPDRVVVVDNGQSLDRPAVDRVIEASGGAAMAVDLLTTEANLGFAGGMNAGISHALAHGAAAVAILNDDTVVEPGWLDALALHLEDDRIGAVQPKLLLDGRGAAVSDEPVIASVGMRVRGDGAGIDLGHGEVDRGQYADAVGIELFTGGAVLLAARFLADVGGFDERYFLYYEDIDLARRGRERGWQYLVEPRAVVHHAMSSTASTLPGLHRYWQERNRLWWLVRHGSPLQVLRGVVLSLARLAKHPIRAQATAIRDGLAGAPWCWRERHRRPVVAPLPVTGRWTVH